MLEATKRTGRMKTCVSFLNFQQKGMMVIIMFLLIFQGFLFSINAQPVRTMGKADIILDDFNSEKSNLKKYGAKEPECKLSRSSGVTPWGGNALSFVFAPDARKNVTLRWNGEWKNCEELVFLLKLPRSEQKVGDGFYRVNIELRGKSGKKYKRKLKTPIPQKESKWEECRFPFDDYKWHASNDWQKPACVKEDEIKSLSLTFHGIKGKNAPIFLAGVGFEKAWTGPAFTISNQQAPVNKGTIVQIDDFVKPDAKEKKMKFCFQVNASGLPTTAASTLQIIAKDYWGIKKGEQVIEFSVAGGRKQEKNVEFTVPADSPGYLQFSASLSSKGKKFFKKNWTMMSQIEDKSGRLACFAEKVRRKEPVTIAYIGGSITVGSGSSGYAKNYYSVSSGMLRRKLDIDGVKYKLYNFAQGGTPSVWGALRLSAYLLNAQKIDLMVIEFAVNDHGLKLKDSLDGVEGIIRQLYAANPDVAIIFFYTTARTLIDDWWKKGKVQNAIESHHKLAVHYGLPEINSSLLVLQGLEEKQTSMKTFFPDGTHPSDLGHKCYGTILGNALLQSLNFKKKDSLPAIPAIVGSGIYTAVKTSDIEPVSQSGEWTHAKRLKFGGLKTWKTTTKGSQLKLKVDDNEFVGFWLKNGKSIRYQGAGYEEATLNIRRWPTGPRPVILPKRESTGDGVLTLEATNSSNGKTDVDIFGLFSFGKTLK